MKASLSALLIWKCASLPPLEKGVEKSSETIKWTQEVLKGWREWVPGLEILLKNLSERKGPLGKQHCSPWVPLPQRV